MKGNWGMDMKASITIFIVLVWILSVIGWVMNIYKFTQCDFNGLGSCEGIRAVGIIAAPLGSIVGWMDF